MCIVHLAKSDVMNADQEVVRQVQISAVQRWRATLKTLQYWNAISHFGVRLSNKGNDSPVAYEGATNASYKTDRRLVSVAGIVCARGAMSRSPEVIQNVPYEKRLRPRPSHGTYYGGR